MKIRLFYAISCLLLISLIPQTIHSCTTFCLDKANQPVVGSNFDWGAGYGLVIVNKRNISKTARIQAWNSQVNVEGQPASWISKYGSITFNMLGLEHPWGGMNEAGLVVTSMGLETTKYPETDLRPSIRSIAWIQYQLDNFSTVEEVIASDLQLRIMKLRRQDKGRIHYLVSDRKGNCAAIEFIDGKLICHTKGTMPAKALANITYKESLDFWQKGKLPSFNIGDSAQRFATAANMIKKFNAKTQKPAVDYAFEILENVAIGTIEDTDGVPAISPMATEWSVVYDIKNLRVYFRTFENKKIRYINISSFDFSCKTPVKVLDIQEDLSGDVASKFVNYTYEINRDMVRKATQYGPDELVDYIAKYPESTVCTE